jgi:hypothetical protein
MTVIAHKARLKTFIALLSERVGNDIHRWTGKAGGPALPLTLMEGDQLYCIE